MSTCAVSGYRCIGGSLQLRKENISGNLSKGFGECVPYLDLLIHIQVFGRLRVYASCRCNAQKSEIVGCFLDKVSMC